MISNYDPDADAFYAQFTPAAVAETREVAPGVMLDLDGEGQLVGIEVLYVSARERGKHISVPAPHTGPSV